MAYRRKHAQGTGLETGRNCAISVGSPRCNGSCRKPHPQSKFAFRSVTYSVMMATVAELCKSAFCYRPLAKASRESALRLLSWMAKEEHRESGVCTCHHLIFKELVKDNFPVVYTQLSECSEEITSLGYDKANAMRYVAGYICRAVPKKITVSHSPLKKQLSLALWELLEDESINYSEDEEVLPQQQ